jgi:hypothetical protein
MAATARSRRNSRSGPHAGEHVIAAARAIYNRAIADGLIEPGASPAHRVTKPPPAAQDPTRADRRGADRDQPRRAVQRQRRHPRRPAVAAAHRDRPPPRRSTRHDYDPDVSGSGSSIGRLREVPVDGPGAAAATVGVRAMTAHVAAAITAVRGTSSISPPRKLGTRPGGVRRVRTSRVGRGWSGRPAGSARRPRPLPIAGVRGSGRVRAVTGVDRRWGRRRFRIAGCHGGRFGR